jgi:hypothetical protein
MGVRVHKVLLNALLVEFRASVRIVRQDFEKEFIWEYRESSGFLAFRA